MEYFLLTSRKLNFVLSITEAWVPSHEFLMIVLIVGALLTAGVALSAFAFYDDFYWGDKKFREDLRFHPSRRHSSNHVAGG